MKPGYVLFDGAGQLFRKWEEPVRTATERKTFIYPILILITLKDSSSRLILTTPRLPFNLPADKASIERAVFVAFNLSFLDFIRNPYLSRINRLFAQNATGWEFPQASVSDVNDLICRLSNSYSPENLSAIMQVLDMLSLSEPVPILADKSVHTNKLSIQEVERLKRIETIVRYIHDNYRRSLPLGEVANLVGLTREHLSTVCSGCLPGGFAGYLLKIRLDEVVRQLVHTNYSILAIAEDCGFASFSNFMTLFKKRYGITPACYRKRVKGEQ